MSSVGDLLFASDSNRVLSIILKISLMSGFSWVESRDAPRGWPLWRSAPITLRFDLEDPKSRVSDRVAYLLPTVELFLDSKLSDPRANLLPTSLSSFGSAGGKWTVRAEVGDTTKLLWRDGDSGCSSELRDCWLVWWEAELRECWLAWWDGVLGRDELVDRASSSFTWKRRCIFHWGYNSLPDMIRAEPEVR